MFDDCLTYRNHQWELSRNVASSSNFLKGVVEGLKFGMLELSVIEPKEVVHNDITGQCWECMGEVHGLFPRLELLHADGESIDVAVYDMYEVQNGTPREPDECQWWTLP